MKPFQLPWLELSIPVAPPGSTAVRRIRDPNAAGRWGLTPTGLAFGAPAFVRMGVSLRVTPASPGKASGPSTTKAWVEPESNQTSRTSVPFS